MNDVGINESETQDIRMDLSLSQRIESRTREGVPYVAFRPGSGPTIMAFGEIADVMRDNLAVDGVAVRSRGVLKVVGIRPFEGRSTMINEIGDDYQEHGACRRAA